MRNRSSWTATAALAAVAGMLSGCTTAPTRSDEQRGADAEAAIQTWSGPSRTAAAALLAEFGVPDQVDSSRLIWRDKRLFKRVAVWDQIPGEEPEAAQDIIEQAVAYRVPQEKRSELAAFSEKIMVSPDGREFSARAESQAVATLSLNMASEILRGIRSPEEARDIYRRTLQLREAGKVSPYMQGLTFQPRR
jgi:hypothetical protein